VLLVQIDRYLAIDDAPLAHAIWERWETLLWRRTQAVRVEQDGATLYGVVEGLSPTGLLRLRTPNGELSEIAVGDVSAI
jgi:biotin-(acetyl-CoA carboxylase) ligase